MPANPDPMSAKDFWSQYNGNQDNGTELDFYDDMASEIFSIYGVPLEYYPVDADPERDRIFNEDPGKKFERKVMLTGIIEGNSVQENVLFNQFGMMNKVEFTMYLHYSTAIGQLGRKPLTADQFTFANGLTTQVFEVTHVTDSTLGVQGNVFGRRTAYALTCREREISPAEIGDGERYGFVDSEGNVLPGAPADLFDENGNIREKYKVPGLTAANKKGAYHGDNEHIQEKADGVDENGNATMPAGKGVVSVSGKDKKNIDWGGW